MRIRSAGQLIKSLGPGIITGAADDDPSGIATYSIAGAQFGLGLIWLSLFTWPLMAAVQMTCARVGMITGQGLVGAFRKKFSRPVLLLACTALFVANTINVGADLAGMADAAGLLVGVRAQFAVVVFGIAITAATIGLRYVAMERVLKWLVLVLFAYVVTPFLLRPNWLSVLRATVIPSIPHRRNGWATIVAILGTTISPYLFFWQASEEVEEEKALGRITQRDRLGATDKELSTRRLDVGIGTLFSNVVMFFIILTTALTLNAHGVTNPRTSLEVATALRPFGGRWTVLLFTIGLVGTGALTIPTLAGSSAYAFAEIFGWRQGMDESYRRARAFYMVVGVSVLMGIALDFAGVNPVRALYWTAVINGVLAPFLLVGLAIAASDSRLMHGQPTPRLTLGIVVFTAVLMFAAAIGMFAL
jgi:NRAMP (natural resistance-associated macrophage protein)-like metal ion transporter